MLTNQVSCCNNQLSQSNKSHCNIASSHCSNKPKHGWLHITDPPCFSNQQHTMTTPTIHLAYTGPFAGPNLNPLGNAPWTQRWNSCFCSGNPWTTHDLLPTCTKRSWMISNSSLLTDVARSGGVLHLLHRFEKSSALKATCFLSVCK